MAESNPDRRRWGVVAGVFLVLTVSSGFGFYNLSVYLSVLTAERGFSVAEVSMAVSVFFVVGGIAGLLVARLIDRYDVRWVMIAGAALGGAALAGVGRVTELWQLYGLYCLFGIGNSAISIVTATTLITRWFPGRERSVALSLASSGLSAGGILLTPLSARLVNAWGLEAAMELFGAGFFLLVLPVAWWVVRGHPPASGRVQPAAMVNADSYRDAVRNRFFVLLTLAYLVCLGVQVGGISHLYNRAVVVADFRVAAYAVQALTACSILGRFLGGWLVTRLPVRAFTLGNLVGQSLGLGLLAFAQGPWSVVAGAAVFGCTVGNLLMLHPLWLAEAYDGAVYPRVFALSNALTVVGVSIGPTLLGLVYEAADYRLAYLTAAGGSLLALVIMASAGARPMARPAAAVD